MIDLSNTPAQELSQQAQLVQTLDDEQLARRATDAWQHEKGSRPWTAMPKTVRSLIYGDKTYVGLGYRQIVLAIYSVRKNGELNRLRQIPMPVCAAIVIENNNPIEDSVNTEETSQ